MWLERLEEFQIFCAALAQRTSQRLRLIAAHLAAPDHARRHVGLLRVHWLVRAHVADVCKVRLPRLVQALCLSACSDRPWRGRVRR